MTTARTSTPTLPLKVSSLTETYTLADGSPRFGVRTAAPEAPEAGAQKPGRDARTVAWEAERLDAFELEAALQFRYRLGDREATEALIAGLRSSHPEELRAAEEIVRGVLGSPAAWLRNAMTFRRARLSADAERNGGPGRTTLAPVVGRLVLGLLPIVAWVAALAAHMNGSIAFVLFVLVSAAVGPYQRRLGRKMRGMLPPNIQPEDRNTLWADAVDATLADLLERNPGVDPAALTAARRAWRHNVSAAAKAHELAYR